MSVERSVEGPFAGLVVKGAWHMPQVGVAQVPVFNFRHSFQGSHKCRVHNMFNYVYILVDRSCCCMLLFWYYLLYLLVFFHSFVKQTL